MSGQEVSLLLQECLRRAVSGPKGDTQTLRRGSFPDDLNTLLQEAADRKWPFVEEKWQYKQSVTSEDKMNSSDLIRKHLPQLLVFLRDSIAADEPEWAVAVVFLVDRLLYWMDGSHVLLKIAKALHKRYPDIPIAPQVIIRQARVYLNTGKLQKAEFILSSLINNKASTGSWTYQKASDQTLVQAVSLQVRGQVLQTLGLWLEAAELTWASLIGFYTLPQPDKKGIGTSLGLLANILTSMNDRDFAALQKKLHIDLSFLGESRHRLLSAAQAAKMAVVFSQYGSLYVLTNVVAHGICLLSYSFSKKCPVEDQQMYLVLAKEAFEIGLLTKMTGDVVTSKLELHTFLKAAYCLATTHRWMTSPSEMVISAMSACREAMTLFVDYCARADSTLCTEIMAKIQQIKLLLKVETFRNSDPRSFIPDSYRSMEFGPVLFTLSDFAKALDVFGKHHKSVCEAFENGVRGGSCSTHAQCITAFQTDTEVLTTEMQKAPDHGADHSSLFSSKQNPSSNGSSLILVDQSCHTVDEQSSTGSYEVVDDFSNGSQEANPSNQSSVSPSFPNTFRNNKENQCQSQAMQELATTEDVEDNPSEMPSIQWRDDQKNLAARTSSSSFSSGSSWERVSGQSQSDIQTEEDVIDPSHDSNEINNDAKVGRPKGGSTSSFSLCDSSASHSSWQKLYISPIANVERLELIHKKERTDQHLQFPDKIQECQGTTLPSTESDPFEELGFEHLSTPDKHQPAKPSSTGDNVPVCKDCFENCIMGSEVLTERDYRSLLAGVCQRCLIERLPNKPLKPLDLRQLEKAYDGVVLKYSKASDVWIGSETSVYIGNQMGVQGKQRQAIEVQYLHQEQLLSSYVGKEYLKVKGLHSHLDDVERQMTAQYYVTEFNKCLYDNNVTTQIFFIPSEVLLVLEKDRIVTCLSAEPYMSGTFVKLTNNTRGTEKKHDATKYGIAFGHFAYEFSNHQEVVVDLQGWITANGKGLTYLTDPQIHSLLKSRSSNFQQTGINDFIRHQHGDECNEICRAAGLKLIT
ncbi:alpha-protein kinase 1 isoform X2 [Sinocyclocheilus anshuiensis]|uniref:alpha-protein kinase 1 isoform X2 n=1 Tax=Sinocyclocheilus anshuiensis TaxID=1608454 RepID=UPI0007B99522|nr:PREDICTED: alpha-protein kinase 1 isoform X2 [Sinocyclocheilus anshuiensis]